MVFRLRWMPRRRPDSLPIDFGRLGLAALSVPGHKGLMGPQGIGALILRPDFAAALEPFVSGGTGSASDSEEQPAKPHARPVRVGNTESARPGDLRLGKRRWNPLRGRLTVETVAAHDRVLAEQFLDGLQGVPGVVLYGPLNRRGAGRGIEPGFPWKR